MRLLIIAPNYPHLKNLMGNAFVHVRAKEYAKHHEVTAFIFFYPEEELEYEGISLRFFNDAEALSKAVVAYQPDKILIHFYQGWMFESIIRKMNVPIIIWVHLFEVIGWYRRTFNFNVLSPVFHTYVLKNIKQQFQFRRLVQYSNQRGRIQFVYVSNWLRKIAEKDTFIKAKHSQVIPNPIDTTLFAYKRKNVELRKSILLLRSFTSRKYANDISAEAILILSKKTFFNELSFTLIGSGPLFDKTLAPLQGFSNIKIIKGGVQQTRIPELHEEFGIFLCPTRQDSHGVSMCEAMSSGLVPIASDNSAIPEYVENGKSGILTTSAIEIAKAIEDIFYHPEKFERLSAGAAQFVRERCNGNMVLQKELELIEEQVIDLPATNKNEEYANTLG